jgi:hypothetical protein
VNDSRLKDMPNAEIGASVIGTERLGSTYDELSRSNAFGDQ